MNDLIWAIIYIAISECLYLLFCSWGKKKDLKEEDNWFEIKMVAFAIGIFFTAIFYVMYTYMTLEVLKQIGLSILIFIALLLFIFLNKYLGLEVAKKR